MIKIVLSGTPPSTSSIYKYRRMGNFIAGYMSAAGKVKKEEIRYELMQQWKRPMILEGFVSLKIIFYFKDNRVRDIDNFNKIIFDAGTGVIWKDDSQIKPLLLDKFVDKENPRVEITIL